MGDSNCGLLSNHFFTLNEYLCIDAKADFTFEDLQPDFMKRASAWQGLQKAISIKNDVPHNDKEYAYVLRPID